MCGTMCCQEPPYATIKAFDNTAPFAFNWRDDKAAPNDGAEFSIRQSTIFGETQSTGCRNPNSGATDGDDGCLLNRNVTTGADERDNSAGFYGRQVSQIPQGLGATETWVVGYNQASGGSPFGYLYTNVGSPGAPYVHAATTDSPVSTTGSWGPAMAGLIVGASTSEDAYGGNPGTRDLYVAKKWNATTGVLTNSMLRTSLTSSEASARALSIVNGGTYSLVVGGNSRLWLLNTSLAEVTTNSLSSGVAVTKWFSNNWLWNTSTPSGSHVILVRTSRISINFTAAIYKVATSGMSLLSLSQLGGNVPTTSGNIVRILAVDATNAYIGSMGSVHARNLTTGATTWTITNFAPTRARVLTAGVAFFSGISGVRIVDPSTGATTVTIDNSQIYDVAEFSSQIFCVGPRRESHE